MSKSSVKRNSPVFQRPVCNFEALKHLPLQKYCSKKFYQIEFCAPLTSDDVDLYNKVVEEGKKYEYLSNVYFITYEDVLDLLERLVRKDSCDLPKSVEECAQELVVEEVDKLNTLSLEFMALLTKLKIIESMYKKYINDVHSMQRRQQVHEQLSGLLHHCDAKDEDDNNKKKKKKGKKDKKKGKSDKSSSKKSKKSDKKSKKGSEKKGKKSKNIVSKTALKEPSTIEIKIDDYTEIVLEDNEFIFDFNIDNHLIYIVLSNFFDPLLIQELAQMNVEVSVVIDVALTSSNLNKQQDVILKLDEMFKTPKKSSYLENTAWLKYRNDNRGSSKEILEEFLYVVKRINYIKRQHLSYIKNLTFVDLGPTPKKLDTECLERYNRLINSYPNELVNVSLILDSLIEEVCWRESGKIYSLSDLTLPSENEGELEKEPTSFQTHEEDRLLMGIKTYNEIGQRCYEQSLKYLGLLQPLRKSETETSNNEVKYINRMVSTSDSCYCDNTKEMIDYLHAAIFCQMKRKEFIPKDYEEFEFVANLVTYDPVKEYQKVVVKSKNQNKIVEDSDIFVNYHMKEDLSTSVLRQIIFITLQNYSCWDRYFCDESNSMLLRFHDNLDNVGVDTKIWCQCLRTPVCLRDFCAFVANEEKQWLQDHKLSEHRELNEKNGQECEGLQDLQVSEMYQEYEYLLETTSGLSREEKKKNFDETLAEVINYPESHTLKSYCGDTGAFSAYDLGPKLCQLTGHTTIFRSKDGVKVTVDTSRFFTEDPRCTITIDSDGNSLVFHKNRPSSFHFLLKDETIVSFSKNDQNSDDLKIPLQEDDVEGSYENEGDEELHNFEEQKVDKEQKVENYNDYWIHVLRKSKISSTIPGILTKTPISDKTIKVDDKNLDRLLELFKAAVYMQHPIYKISTKPSLRYVNRKSSPLYLPLVGTLKRILFKPIRKKRTIVSYSVLNLDTNNKKVLPMYHFQITLPNGLVLSTFPQNNEQVTEVKQEYKYSRYKEKYRMFYSTGVIVIKNIDGSTTILRSNGDIVNLSDESECHPINCTHFFKNEEETRQYRSSRSSGSPKMKIRTDFMNLYEFGNIPYSKKTLLELNGKLTIVSRDSVKEKQKYYVITEHDYHADEVFYDREDGMKCIDYKKGTRVFQFPDGSKITSWPAVEKNLVHITSNPKVEGWVSVVVNYKYEHRDYLTVLYDQTQSATEIFLKDGVIKTNDDSIVLSLYKSLALEVTSTSLILLKTCDSCDGDCICKIHTNGIPKLLEMCDSYDKYFSCDSSGRCEINSNYESGPLNKRGCDHARKNEEQRFFIVDDSKSSGVLLWKDEHIERKISASKNNKSVRIVNYMNKLTKKHTIEFFTNIYQNFIGKFTMTSLYESNICLSKKKHMMGVEKPRIFYVTFRILTEFLNLRQQGDLTELIEYLESRIGKSASTEGIKYILQSLSTHQEEDICSYKADMKEIETAETKSDSVSTESVNLDQLTVQDIILKWREQCDHYKYLIKNKIFTPYFNSSYYMETYKK